MNARSAEHHEALQAAMDGDPGTGDPINGSPSRRQNERGGARAAAEAVRRSPRSAERRSPRISGAASGAAPAEADVSELQAELDKKAELPWLGTDAKCGPVAREILSYFPLSRPPEQRELPVFEAGISRGR